MRTSEARRIRNKGLKRAKRNGHVVATICESESFSAYGCMNCNDVMDFWDSPAGMNGPMAHRKCGGNRHPTRTRLKNILTRIRNLIFKKEKKC
jgi:hypothetical protein